MSKSKSKSGRGRCTLIILFSLYMVALLYLYFGKVSNFVHVPLKIWDMPYDKVAHFLMFLPYPFLAHGSKFTGKAKWRDLVFVILSGIVVSYVLELIQSTISPFRTTEAWDLVANVAAITVGSFILSLIDLLKK